MASKMEQPSPRIRSSLEQMLESLRKRDAKAKDAPPALPSRPVSRGRLPSARRSLPVNFKIDSKTEEYLSNGSLEEQGGNVKWNKTIGDKEPGFRSSGMFGSKKLKTRQTEESPYIREPHKTSERLSDGVSLSSDMVAGPSSASLSSAEVGLTAVEEYVLKKKIPVWCVLGEADWRLGKIQSISGADAHVILINGNDRIIPKEKILPANPDILDDIDDLIQLSFLNEPSVLHCLQNRYFHDAIYTKAGSILISINPFKDVGIYGNDLLKAYREKMVDKPHVFLTARNAICEMMRDGLNQSIIFCGESGSGKTEAAKAAMRYLLMISGGSGLECKILQTNCILEAFGNAKTSLNDNSTRFGKLIEIYFSEVGKLCGANIETFSFEKSRVVQRAISERSYHIFYQLCAGAPPVMKETLDLKTASYYEYLKHGDCLTIDNIDDTEKFHFLLDALNIVGLHKKDQDDMFSMLAAILWLGNISFKVIDNENHVEVVLAEGVSNASRLLGCDEHDLILALTTRKIQEGKNSLIQKLSLPEAIDTRDALATSTYAYLFDWLVEKLNKSFEVGKHCRGRSISILDIYGFETFHKNGFEQFCINYSSERLQQHFNRHLFKLLEEEYAEDGLDWRTLNIVDNSECLDLFEKKPLGLLHLLEEESAVLETTDTILANKFKQHFDGHPCFKEIDGVLSIKHYAGEVLYGVSGFLEKNRDTLHSESIELLFSSASQLSKMFASGIPKHPDSTVGSLRPLSSADYHKQSATTKFKGQVFKLIQRLEETNPHFVQCIKPNSKLRPGLFESGLVVQQLRCCGVLEVVKISRCGYSARLTHQEFAERSSIHISCCSSKVKNSSKRISSWLYKVIFRIGQIQMLEDLRNKLLLEVIKVQKSFRGSRAQQYFNQVKIGITVLQSFIRGEYTRCGFNSLIKRKRAAVIIQKHAKGLIARKMFGSWMKAAISIQCVTRCWLARHQYLVMREVRLHSIKKFADKLEDYSPNRQHVDQSIFRELQKRVGEAEKVAQQREEECNTLRQQLKVYETRCSESDAKMKSSEEMWQRQLKSLQNSLAAARQRLPVDDVLNQPGWLSNCPEPLVYDSEDALSHRTPDGTAKSDCAPGRFSDSAQHPVSHLAKEFELKKQVFENDAQHIEVISHQVAPDMNPEDDLRKLKLRFSTWKKEYKARLREAKLTLRKEGHYVAGKCKKKWWRNKKLKAINIRKIS